MKPEVKSPLNRICISYDRRGHKAFAVFLLSFLSDHAAGRYAVFIAVRPLSIWISFTAVKQQSGLSTLF